MDDESKTDLPFDASTPADKWVDSNPPYAYYLYYMWANLKMLNEFRRLKGFSNSFSKI